MPVPAYEIACLRGVKAAFKQHLKMSGGLPLGLAPESYIQTHIAMHLAKIAPYVTLETKVYDALIDASAELRGKPSRNFGGRVDIVTWWKNETPRVLIEVKKMHGRETIAADVKRIKQLLRRGGTTREGLVVVYCSAKKPKTLEGRVKHAASTSRVTIGARTGHISYPAYWSGSTWLYEAVCFRVRA